MFRVLYYMYDISMHAIISSLGYPIKASGRVLPCRGPGIMATRAMLSTCDFA